MCVVSMVTDHFQQKWPREDVKRAIERFVIDQQQKQDTIEIRPNPFSTNPFTPQTILPVPAGQVIITKDQFDEYLALKKRAEEYDKATGQPDCVKDGVDEWEHTVKELIKVQGEV